MILPSNSRQVLVNAINDSPIVPYARRSTILNDVANAGYGVVGPSDDHQIYNVAGETTRVTCD